MVMSKHHWCPAQKLPTHKGLCGLDRLPPRAQVIQTFSPHSPIRFESELKAMTGHALNWYWKVMWGCVSPLLIISLFIFYLSDYIITGTLQYQAWDAAQVSAVSGVLLSETKCLSRIGGQLFLTLGNHHPAPCFLQLLLEYGCLTMLRLLLLRDRVNQSDLYPFFFCTFSPFRSPQSSEQSSLCYRAGSH